MTHFSCLEDMSEIEENKEQERYQWYAAILPVLIFMIICVLVQTVGKSDWFTGILYDTFGLTSITQLGILPREKKGLPGIFFWVFIHGDWNHLLNNMWSLGITGVLLFKSYKDHAYKICSFIALAGGLAVWFSARPGSYHIGASGLIYGISFFLIFMGFFRKDKAGLAIAFLVIVMHGGLIVGLLPIREGVSWEGHLAGALAGIVMALWYREDYKPEVPDWMQAEDEEDLPFFERAKRRKLR